MKESAFCWWNDVICPDRDALSVPELQMPSEMAPVWAQISTIVQSLIDPLWECNEYWDSVTYILQQLTGQCCVPNPIQNFPEFVVFLYSNRKALKQTDPETLGRYVETFCRADKMHFFMSQFVCAAGEPLSIIKAFAHLHATGNDQWLSFIRQGGSVERVVDLFITFLNQYQDANSFADEIVEFKLELATFLTTLLVEVNGSLTLADDVISNFYSRLLKLIKYSTNESSVSFLRCAMEINDRWLPFATQEEAATRISTLVASTQTPRIIRPIVLAYARQQAGKFIAYKNLVTVILKQTLNSIADFEILHDIASDADMESRLLVIRFFARRMTQNKTMMRISASLLSNLLAMSQESKEIKKWFMLFVNSLFCFFKIATARHKYTRRILQLCEVLSCGVFDKCQWANEIIIDAASCSFAVGRKFDYLKLYFPIRKIDAGNFEALLSKLSNSSAKLKSFPFKTNSFTLIENGRYRGKVKLPREFDEKIVDEGLRGIGLRPVAAQYVYEDFESGPVDQQRCIFELEDFIEREQEKADALQVSRESKSYPNPKDFSSQSDIEIIGINTLLKEYDQKIFEYQNNTITEYIRIALEIVNAISQHAHLFVNQKLIARNLNATYSSSPGILNLKRSRNRIANLAILRVRNFKAPPPQVSFLRNDVSESVKRFMPKLQYSPPSKIETDLGDYLRKHPLQEREDDHAAAAITQKTIPKFVQSVFLAAKTITSKLKLSFNLCHPVVTDSILRIAFDKAYCESSDLCRFSKFNQQFIKSTHSILQTPISDLRLRPEIIKKIPKCQTLGSLFMKSRCRIGYIQWLTNPLDISFALYSAIQSLPSLLNVSSLTTEESSQLLLGLLAIDPPSNPVAISVFLDRFNQSIASLDMFSAINAYQKAISSIIDMKEVAEEQHEIDSDTTMLGPDVTLSIMRACEQSEE